MVMESHSDCTLTGTRYRKAPHDPSSTLTWSRKDPCRKDRAVRTNRSAKTGKRFCSRLYVIIIDLRNRLNCALSPLSWFHSTKSQKMSCTSISSFVRRAASKSYICNGIPYIRNKSRCFSISASRRIMETSGFTPEQLTVREAISKICSNFPDVRFLQFLHYPVDN